jgi:RNA polymerase-binding protein DksA
VSVDADHFRARLESERGRVLGALENLRRENSGSMDDEVDESHHDNHLAETASVTLDREMDYSLEENEARVLAAIDAALNRLDEGTYGQCERCGRPIESERLDALPWATLCIDDKRREEQS